MKLGRQGRDAQEECAHRGLRVRHVYAVSRLCIRRPTATTTLAIYQSSEADAHASQGVAGDRGGQLGHLQRGKKLGMDDLREASVGCYSALWLY